MHGIMLILKFNMSKMLQISITFTFTTTLFIFIFVCAFVLYILLINSYFLQIMLQGIPRNALPDDIERFLTGCQYAASSMQIFLRLMTL